MRVQVQVVTQHKSCWIFPRACLGLATWSPAEAAVVRIRHCNRVEKSSTGLAGPAGLRAGSLRAARPPPDRPGRRRHGPGKCLRSPMLTCATKDRVSSRLAQMEKRRMQPPLLSSQFVIVTVAQWYRDDLRIETRPGFGLGQTVVTRPPDRCPRKVYAPRC